MPTDQDASDLGIALRVLDEYACWGYAPTMEPASVNIARAALVLIRGGDGRPLARIKLTVSYECPEHGKQEKACCEGARRKEHR